jgi:V/A-type H+-transporting ATPase subunit C
MPKSVYVGTTAAALKGTLLGRSAIEKLVESRTLEELVNRLKGTPYSSVLSTVSPPYAARRLELAFRERLADVHFLIMTLAKGYDLVSLYYLRQIAWDLKYVLKSKALGKSDESMEYLAMHAEELVGRRDLVVKIIAARDIQEIPSLLSGTEFSEDITMAIAAFSAKKEIRLFDLYIDHAVLSRISTAYSSKVKLYSSSRAVDVAGVGEMVALDIDSYNILSVLRAKLWRLPEEEVRSLIVNPPHNSKLTNLQGLIATESLGETVKQLGNILPESPQWRGSGEETIDFIEDSFTAESMKVASKAFVWQGFGLAAALALTKLLEFEVKNLAAIAIGVEAGMDARDVLSKLVF